MSDVPTCGHCGGPLTKLGDEWECQNLAPVKPKPRAVVAISEDRQWLVVLEPDIYRGVPAFSLLRWSEQGCTWEEMAVVTDIGQSAQKVLTKFLRERAETTRLRKEG